MHMVLVGLLSLSISICHCPAAAAGEGVLAVVFRDAGDG